MADYFTIPVLIWLALGYLLGTIPFGLLLTRLAGLGDVRNIGSGNIGATNVLRTGRKGLAALTLLGDGLKGTAAVLLAAHFADAETAIAAGLGAFLGHLFPVWLGFRGGKGVATYAGVALGFSWIGLVTFAVVWIGVAFVTRYSSLSALVAVLVVPLVFWWTGMGTVAGLFVLLAVLVYVKHRANIERLLAGTESRIGAKG